MEQDDVLVVQDALGRLILQALRRTASVQYQPPFSPDQMDEEIAFGQAQAVKLRDIRQQFETCITGVLNIS